MKNNELGLSIKKLLGSTYYRHKSIKHYLDVIWNRRRGVEDVCVECFINTLDCISPDEVITKFDSSLNKKGCFEHNGKVIAYKKKHGNVWLYALDPDGDPYPQATAIINFSNS